MSGVVVSRWGRVKIVSLTLHSVPPKAGLDRETKFQQLRRQHLISSQPQLLRQIQIGRYSTVRILERS